MSLLDQYKRAMTRTEIIGGPYNRPDAIVQRGFHPTVEIIPLNDGVQVLQGSGSNLYNASVWASRIQVNGTSDNGASTAYVSREIFFKFAEPVNDIRAISFPWSNGDFNTSNSNLEFGTQQTGSWRSRVGLNLMKFNMDLGQPLGLDALTGINAAWGENSSAHGNVVYATPSNFDDFFGRGAELWTGAEETTVAGIIGGQTSMGSTSLGWANDPTANNDTLLGVSFGVPKTDGPYFGVHVFFHSSQLLNDPLFFWKGEIDYVIQAELLSPRPGIPTVRGHVIGSPLLSF